MTFPSSHSPLIPITEGKVRQMFPIGGVGLLVRATDRISVFDVVLDQPVPDKGKVLTALTEFWLTGPLRDIPNHFISTDLDRNLPTAMQGIPDIEGRSMVVRRADMMPIECIVRGYLYGSGWDQYRADGTVSGLEQPPGLLKASKLPEPIFTPSTKATSGHDININLAEAGEIADQAFPGQGRRLMASVVELSFVAYGIGAQYALERGIIIADTKFEFGLVDGELILCDEVLTPDSSRFWPVDSWQPGKEPVSMDKQYVRDYYAQLGWNKQPPAPHLPDDIVAETSRRYREIYQRLVA